MAKKGKDKNYISFWFWLFIFFIISLPCIGLIMIVVWAFIGENETRKNYCRALLFWILLLTFLWVGLALAGFAPLIIQHLQIWIHRIQQQL